MTVREQFDAAVVTFKLEHGLIPDYVDVGDDVWKELTQNFPSTVTVILVDGIPVFAAGLPPTRICVVAYGGRGSNDIFAETEVQCDCSGQAESRPDSGDTRWEDRPVDGY